jgi:Domain of unknown function DUF29
MGESLKCTGLTKIDPFDIRSHQSPWNVSSRFFQTLMHLLKYEFQPEQRSGSWLGSIKESRKQIKRLCRKYPSLKPYLEQCWEECYSDAIEDASDETGLPQSQFPARCPYAIAEVLDPEFLPN